MQRRLLGHLPELQPDGHGRDVHADSGRHGADAGHPVRGHGGQLVRDRRPLQRRGGVPELRRRHRVRRRELHRIDAVVAADL